MPRRRAVAAERAARESGPSGRRRRRCDTGSSSDWPGADAEVVRILGIDTPETRRLEHNLPFDQPFGKEANRFRTRGVRRRKPESSCFAARHLTHLVAR